MTMPRFVAATGIAALVLTLGSAAALAQSQVTFVGMGDSIGEGVQSADANSSTQPNTYLALVAAQMGEPFTLPLIRTSPLGVVGSTTGRSRIDPAARTADLAVSGADSGSILSDSAGWPVDDETDLVELPRTGTQVEIAQRLRPPWVICWIGNNDVLGAVLAFDHLDASQITPQDVFADNFQAIVDGVTGWHDRIVFANIPDVTRIGFLMSPEDLKLFLGDSYGLPDGSYTSIVAMMMIRMGLLPPTILRDGRIAVIATNGTITVLNGGKVETRIPIEFSVAAAAASHTHFFVSTWHHFITFDASTLQEVGRYDWPDGGLSAPAIGPQGNVYAIASNQLYVFPGPGQTGVAASGSGSAGPVAQSPAQPVSTEPTQPAEPVQPSPASRKAYKPPMTVGGNRLFACQNLEEDDCGKGDARDIAKAFCQKQGFAAVGDLDIDTRKGKAETLDGRFCARNKCRVFSKIVCTN